MHEAIKSARDLKNKNAELVARLALCEEQIRQLREQSQKVQPLQIENQLLKSQVSHYCERAVLLEEELRWLKAQVFGRAAPHHSPDTAADQRMLFNEAEVLTAIEAADAAHANRKTTIGAHERQHTGGRKAIPEAFPRKNISHDIEAGAKFCPHDGTALERFGEETSERYGYRRPKIWVERHIRHRYGCPTCRSGEAIKMAPVPAQLLPKTNAGSSLLAHLIANKFVDGIPIYRTCGQLERLGLDLSPSTAGTWINATGDKMTALIQLMHEELLSASFIHMDETYLQVLKSEKAPTSTHYMVVRAGGPPGRRIVLFNYAASRTVQALKSLLIGPNGAYQGKLLTDGLELYDSVVEALSLRHYGCLAHCRQYFDKAAKVTELPSGRSLARVALEEYLGKVYGVERKVKALRKAGEQNGIAPLLQILELRHKEAAPIMAAFKKWVDDLLPGVPPKTALGKALAYTTRQWDKLQRFLSDPEMPADNNYCENQIRPFAVGRRAWLFVDSHIGATASANLYSIVMTCRANGIEPDATCATCSRNFRRQPRPRIWKPCCRGTRRLPSPQSAASTTPNSSPNVTDPQSSDDCADQISRRTYRSAYQHSDIQGTLTVNGVEYNGAMPEFGSQLNDAEIAAALIKFAVSGA